MRRIRHCRRPGLYGAVSCLLLLSGLVAPARAAFDPLNDTFTDPTLDPSRWIQVIDADVSDDGEGEPSGPYSARLRGQSTLASRFMDASGAAGVIVSYSWQRTGSRSMNSPEPGEDLIVEYTSAFNYWKRIVRHPGDGPDGLSFRQETWRLPSDALGDWFRIRFRTTGNHSKDHFYIDDVSVVEDLTGVPAPFPNCVTEEHIFPFEDEAGVLIDPSSSDEEMASVIRDAVQALVTTHGDGFDFVALWSTTPQASGYPANFSTLYRNIQGIRSLDVGPITDQRSAFGFTTTRLKGFANLREIEAWDTNPWGVSYRFIAHEIGHFWGAFLPPLADGRALIQMDGVCNPLGGHHWDVPFSHGYAAFSGNNHLYDPATGCYQNSGLGSDVGGGDYTPVELYLMGYMAPEEVDPLRDPINRVYFDTGCNFAYCGTVSPWSIQDIIDVVGPRVPAAADAQKDFRIGWAVIHQPGAPPTADQLAKYVQVANEWPRRWGISTFDRGSMTGQLFRDADCDGVEDSPFDDFDGDGLSPADGDCDDWNPAVWSAPGPVGDLVVQVLSGVEGPQISWLPPVLPGGSVSGVRYDTLVSTTASDFTSPLTTYCAEYDDGTDTVATDLGGQRTVLDSSSFEGDTPGAPPATGVIDRPTSLVVPSGGTILVESQPLGMSSQSAVIRDEGLGNYGSLVYRFADITSDFLIIEDTISVNRTFDGFILQNGTNVGPAARLGIRSNGELVEDRFGTPVGTYQPGVPFGVRLRIDVAGETWSATVDNERNGFWDDNPVTGLPFMTGSGIVLHRSASATMFISSANGPVEIAHDNLLIIKEESVGGSPVRFYLTRAENDCGAGSVSKRSDGIERIGRTCP